MNYQVSKIILGAVALVAIGTMGEVVVDDAGHAKTPKERLDAMKCGKRASDVDVTADRERRLRRRMEAMRAAATVNRSKGDAHVSGNANPGQDSFRHEASDREIKDLLISATAPICDFDARGKVYDRAVSLCDGDDARFSRVVIEIARERPDRLPWALCVLANHGSAENLPFIYAHTNDTDYAALAVKAIVYIKGVNDSSVELVDYIMNKKLKNEHDKYSLCAAVAHAGKREGVTIGNRDLAVTTLKRYSRTIPVTSLWADEFLLSLDPSYETSDDRKALLREVAARRVNDYQIDYATNALKRIDAKIQVERKGD
jgi:hypothetical protein